MRPENPIIPLIEEFLEAQRIDRGASDHTISAYKQDLHQLSEHLGSGIADVTPEDLEKFVARLARRKQQASSIARKISAIRQFFKFLCLEGRLEANPAEDLESPKLARRLPKHLSLSDVERLLEAARDGLPYPGDARLEPVLQARDRAMVFLLYATGVRISELVSLTAHDLDTENGYLRVRGKGGKQRIAPFAAVAGEHLLSYLKARPALSPRTDHVFVNHRGFALTRQWAWKTLKDLALQAGIRAPLSPHWLRHSFATHLLQSGMNLRSLQTLLGHSDLSTTQIYAHVTPEHLQAAHRRYHPRGGRS